MVPGSGQAAEEAVPVVGGKIPPGYRDWRLISVAHEEGNLNESRAIPGNGMMPIDAQREGKRCRSPDGASLLHRFSQPMVRSTIQRLGRTTNVFAASDRFTISRLTCFVMRHSAA